MTVTVLPTLPLLTLNDDERALVTRLDNVRNMAIPSLELRDAYYNGNQVIRDLGISIPPSIRGLSIVVGWPQVAVDALEERLDVEGFRFADQSNGDDTLNGIWQDSNLDEESQLAHLEAMIHGRAYVVVGSNGGDSPLITVESALDMSHLWDPRTKGISAALRVYGGDERGMHRQATLYLPNETIYLDQGETTGEWIVEERDQHGMGEPMVALLANRARIRCREGHSEITNSVMSITDGACRTILGLEVAREFYAAAKLVLLGADESAFVGPDGTAKSVWQTYIGRILALDRDEDGNLPDLKKIEGSDPTPFTRIMSEFRQNFATVTKLPPYMLGETTQNPASADAIRSAENGLVRRAERRQKAFSGAWETVMRLALRVTNGGHLPAGATRIETDWGPAATPTPAATSDSLAKQQGAGFIPARSDVALKRLGYSMAERKRIADEFNNPDNLAEEFVEAVASAVAARASRVTNAAVNTDVQATTPPAPTQ